MRLRLVGITKKFLSFRARGAALDGLSFEVKDGEFFVIVGPSGCGKSTLLNIIAGLEKPTEGEVWFDDKPVASHKQGIFVSPRKRNVAMVFQSYALYPHLNVFENIAFPLRVTRLDKRQLDDSVRGAADKMGISHLLAVRPKELSGGERQRVAIARAIVRQPNLFLLDEPLSNLDARLRLATRTELKILQRSLGVTTVYVTHDQVEAMTLGDKIAVIKSGRLQQVGTPMELYDKPANPFVAGFIGSPPMNIYETRLTFDGTAAQVKIGGETIQVPDSLCQPLGNFKDRDIVLGIRPEHVSLKPDAGPGLKAKIDSIEPLGRETLVHLRVGSESISMLSTDTTLREEDVVRIHPDMDKAHVFSLESAGG